MQTPQEPRRKTRKNYRKLFLERYILYTPKRGLGQHRLPKFRDTDPHKVKPPKERMPASLRLLLVLGGTVAVFICLLLCLIPLQAIIRF